MGQREGIDSKFAAVGLSFILTTTGLVYYLMQPPLVFLEPWEKRINVVSTPHDAIWIDGDANFSDTALLEGWPGDGSPEDPFIIDGLEIDDLYGTLLWPCIGINNTRVSFTISNCYLIDSPGTNAGVPRGAGIYLNNVTNGKIVNNNCSNNLRGIYLIESDYNIVENNNCTSNKWGGIVLQRSHHNTVVNNTCTNTERGEDPNGIELEHSDFNIISDNTCNDNWIGIHLYESESNTVEYNTCNSNNRGIELEHSNLITISDNTCNDNGIGICLIESEFDTVANNTLLDNIEHDIVGGSRTETSEAEQFVAQEFVWFLAGSGMILAVSVIAFVQFRRVEII
jgi:parallel beta-helix repeat protein